MAKFDKEPKSRGVLVQEQVRRLSRVAGQVNGVARMVVEGRAASDILLQIKAIRSALDAVEERIVNQALQETIQKILEETDRGRQAQALTKLLSFRLQAARRLGGDSVLGTGTAHASSLPDAVSNVAEKSDRESRDKDDFETGERL